MRCWVLLFALVVTVVSVAYGQESTTGTIFGRVTDEQGGVVPGATITVSSEMGTKIAVSDANGRFLVPYLTPGLYSVHVELSGFAPIDQGNVDVRLGQRTELLFELKVGGIAETVTVLENSPVVDVTTTTIGGTIDSDLLEKIPVGRQLADTLYIVPGVSSGGLTGQTNPSLAGGAGLDNQYYIDGVNVSDSGYGSLGVYTFRFNALGQGVTYEFIDEVQVKTGGYEAEYGQSTGGVVNVITKSGTNTLRGSVFGYVQTAGLEAERKSFDWVNGRSSITGEARNDFGFTLGGPILQDRAFFFGALHPQWNTRSFLAPEGFPLRDLGDVDRTRQFVSYAAKVTFHMSPNHRLDASFFGDPATSDTAPQKDFGDDLLANSTATFSRLEFGGDQQIVKYQGILSEHWLLEASFARAANSFEEIPSVDEWQKGDFTVVPIEFSGGIGPYETSSGENLQYRAVSTHLLGNHQLRYGFSYEDIRYDSLIQVTGPPVTLPDGTATVTGARIRVLPDPTFGRITRVLSSVINNQRPSTQKYSSFFLQDKFDLGERFTVSAGLRYEQQKLAGNAAEMTWDGNWAPRIGFIFDPSGQGRSKIIGSYGRFFAKIPNDLGVRAMSSFRAAGNADYFDEALTTPVPEGVLALNTTRHLVVFDTDSVVFDPNSKSTVLDEALVGFEWEAIPELNLGLRYIWRDLGRVLEDMGTASITLYFTDPELAGMADYFISNVGPEVPTLNDQGAFEYPVRNYQAVELTADKRFSDRWALFGSYRWSRLHGNFEGFFRNDNGQSDPAITSLFDFPTDDPTYAELAPVLGLRGDIRFLGDAGAGPLPNDRTHQFKLYGTYAFDNGLGVGVGFLASSGRPLTPLAAIPGYGPGEIPEARRGSGIETVDGFQKRADFLVQLDLHADYAIALGERSRVVLAADLFNLFNQQAVLGYNEFTEVTFHVPDPDFGRPVEYTAPFRARFGARLEF